MEHGLVKPGLGLKLTLKLGLELGMGLELGLGWGMGCSYGELGTQEIFPGLFKNNAFAPCKSRKFLH